MRVKHTEARNLIMKMCVCVLLHEIKLVSSKIPKISIFPATPRPCLYESSPRNNACQLEHNGVDALTIYYRETRRKSCAAQRAGFEWYWRACWIITRRFSARPPEQGCEKKAKRLPALCVPTRRANICQAPVNVDSALFFLSRPSAARERFFGLAQIKCIRAREFYLRAPARGRTK